jgi:hypothetical protein
LSDILERRARLVAKAAAEREQLAAGIERLQPAAAAGDALIRIGRTVAAHPEWLVAAGVVVAVARPRLILRLAGKGWLAWRAVRTLRRYLTRLQG